MKKNTITAFILTLFASFALVFSGCGENGDNGLEEAGEEMDEAVEEAGDEVEDATD